MILDARIRPSLGSAVISSFRGADSGLRFVMDMPVEIE